MKKFLSIALALLMVCVMLPIVALADETTAVAKLTVGGTVTYHDTLVEAVAAAINKQGAKIDVLKSCNGSGVEVKFPDVLDLTIDFHGFTYTMDGTAVGSTGYETQAWHIERGSKLTLANGKLEASSTLGAWLLFQNYCDLTLDNMELNTQKANCDYVVSNNFGSLTVKGNSKIIAADGKIAFDIWYGMNEVYDDGITVSFENFTGVVEGDIEYGAHNRVNNAENWQQKATLKIDGGTFNGEIKKGNTSNTLALEDANITVTGGTFTNETTKNLVTSYIPEGSNLVVNPATGKVESKTITIIVPGDTTPAETPKTDDQKNPATGANDFVGLAAAAAVVALLGSAVVLRKK